MTNDDALILMAKAPVPGKVKTRLTPPLSETEAAALYSCLLEDTASEMARLKGVARYLFFAPAGGGTAFLGEPFSRFIPFPQSGRDLGARMGGAFETAFARGHERVVLIGADCPALAASLVHAAYRELASSAGAVFGPSRDGGFYLIALSSPAPFLFRGMNWGASSVLSDASARCCEAGLPYSLLPPRFDIDTGADIVALARWAKVRSSPACPRTRRWLISRGDG